MHIRSHFGSSHFGSRVSSTSRSSASVGQLSIAPFSSPHATRRSWRTYLIVLLPFLVATMPHSTGWRKRTAAQVENRRLRCNGYGVPYYKPPTVPAPVTDTAITVDATTFPMLKLTRIKKWADPNDEEHFSSFNDTGDSHSGDLFPPPAPPPLFAEDFPMPAPPPLFAEDGFTGNHYTSNLSANAPPYFPIPAQATGNMLAPTILPSIGQQLDCFLQNICDQVSAHMAATIQPPATDTQEHLEATMNDFTAKINYISDKICTKLDTFTANTESNAADDNSGYDAITLSAKVDNIEAKLDELTAYILHHRDNKAPEDKVTDPADDAIYSSETQAHFSVTDFTVNTGTPADFTVNTGTPADMGTFTDAIVESYIADMRVARLQYGHNRTNLMFLQLRNQLLLPISEKFLKPADRRPLRAAQRYTGQSAFTAEIDGNQNCGHNECSADTDPRAKSITPLFAISAEIDETVEDPELYETLQAHLPHHTAQEITQLINDTIDDTSDIASGEEAAIDGNQNCGHNECSPIA